MYLLKLWLSIESVTYNFKYRLTLFSKYFQARKLKNVPIAGKLHNRVIAFMDFLAIALNSSAFTHVSNHPGIGRDNGGLGLRKWDCRHELERVTSHAVRRAAGLMAVPLREAESHHRKYILNSPSQLCVIQFRVVVRRPLHHYVCFFAEGYTALALTFLIVLVHAHAFARSRISAENHYAVRNYSFPPS